MFGVIQTFQNDIWENFQLFIKQEKNVIHFNELNEIF